MYKSDLEIAQGANMINIKDVANKLGVKKVHQYGDYMGKLDLNIMDENQKDGKLILVTAINPTKAGEGKSTTTVGLSDAINKLGYNSIVALREPSLGPVFGMKGGAAGGGYAQVLPMEDLNLHFTGDMHAITTANNLISACIDNHIYHGNELNLDVHNITWRRCLDMNDRSLREIEIGLGSKFNGVNRKDGFNITVASEIMAILCLASSAEDLKVRLESIIIGYNVDREIVYLKDLKISGALLVVLKDAIKPNLVQSTENNPVIVHGGPFANIAHGCNSIIATRTALKLGDYVVTEAGFGADLGAEKFLNIKSRVANLNPNCIVIVATIRALKSNAYIPYDQLNEENVEALIEGCANLEKHVENIKKFKVPFVIGINKFVSDTDDEVNALIKWAKEKNYPIELSEVWEHGGNGGIDLAKKVVELCEIESQLEYLYELNDSIENKIKTIAFKIYGAKKVIFSDIAIKEMNEFTKQGFNNLPICMAKTPISLSDNPKLLGCPKDFDLHVSELRISNGAGFIVVLTGSIMTMPGLPKHPSANDLQLTPEGKIEGLF